MAKVGLFLPGLVGIIVKLRALPQMSAMAHAAFRITLIAAGLAQCLIIAACSNAERQRVGEKTQEEAIGSNPVFYFEIPVNDMDRAVAFYEHVFRLELTRRRVDGYDMAFFPRNGKGPGASGALALGDVYRPSKEGAIIYFDVNDIDAVLARATERGADVLYDKKDIGKLGFVAEFEDTEGNRIALSQIADPE